MSVISEAIRPKLGYEAVFTVHGYHGGPREGVANLHGIPHFYECIFDDKRDEYSDSYLLIAISQEVFKAAIENWQIFLRWRKAYDAGSVGLETHPALPRDKSRYTETKQTLDQAVASGRNKAIRAKGEFEILGEPDLPRGVLAPWQVKWREP